jgi:hypothetical protein
VEAEGEGRGAILDDQTGVLHRGPSAAEQRC